MLLLAGGARAFAFSCSSACSSSCSVRMLISLSSLISFCPKRGAGSGERGATGGEAAAKWRESGGKEAPAG